MDERLIHLTDGTTMGVKVNFATLYYVQKEHVDKLLNKKKMTEDDEMEAAARLVYIILRSNGRKVDFDEAIRLVPLDEDEISILFKEFGDRLEDYKKKQKARAATKKYQQSK